MGRKPLNLTALLADPAVVAIIAGVVCQGSMYYRRDANGQLEQVRPWASLVELFSTKTASRILKEARERGLIQESASVLAEASIKSKAAPHRVQADEDEDGDRPKRRKPPRKSRYSSLIYTNNGFVGIWDDYECRPIIVSRSESEAVRELARLRRQEDRVKNFQFFTGVTD
jgi:hypothetical protein